MNSQLPLTTLACTIKASIAAGDKAADKAEQHYKAAGLYLAEAKQIVSRTKQTWPAFCIAECGVGRRRADQYIELAEGRTSLVKMREGYAKANANRNVGNVHAQSAPITEQTQHTIKSIDGAPPQPDSADDGDEAWAVKRFMFAVNDIIDSVNEVTGYIEDVSLSKESAETLQKACEKVMTAWNAVKWSIKTDSEDDDEDSETPAQQKEFFIFQTNYIIDNAKFDGVPDDDICAAAQRVAKTWTNFVTDLDRKTCVSLFKKVTDAERERAQCC
jgi:hypothetical protein